MDFKFEEANNVGISYHRIFCNIIVSNEMESNQFTNSFFHSFIRKEISECDGISSFRKQFFFFLRPECIIILWSCAGFIHFLRQKGLFHLMWFHLPFSYCLSNAIYMLSSISCTTFNSPIRNLPMVAVYWTLLHPSKTMF